MITEVVQKIAFVGVVQFFWMITDHDKGGRRRGNLGTIENLSSPTRFGRRWVLANDHFQHCIQICSAHTAHILLIDFVYFLKNLSYSLSCFSTHEYQRGKAKKFEPLSQFLCHSI